MFCHIFGEYLIRANKLTQSQLSRTLDYLQMIRVKLGFIAIAEKLLTEEQVLEINQMQNKVDRRFGDIAVTKGDLTTEQLNYLLSLQGNAYLQLIQALTELGYLTLEEFEEALKEYQQENGYTEKEIESLKSGDVDRIADVLLHMDDQLSNELAHLCLRNMNRFISNHFYFSKALVVEQLKINHMVYQKVNGSTKWFLGFASDEEGLLSIAHLYSDRIYDTLNEAAIEAVQDFIQCTNGVFCTKLNEYDKEVFLTPEYCENATLVSQKEIYTVPVVVGGKTITIVIGMQEGANLSIE